MRPDGRTESRGVRRAHRNPLVRMAHPTERPMTLEIVSSNKSFGGWHKRYRHRSSSLNCDMVFAVYLPPQAEQGEKLPVLYWLASRYFTVSISGPAPRPISTVSSARALMPTQAARMPVTLCSASSPRG